MSVEKNKKKIKALINFKLNAQSATAGPPVGTTLGQFGVPAAAFCTEFNEQTVSFKKNVQLFVRMRLYQDNTYTFKVTAPCISFLVRRTAKQGKLISKNMVNFLTKNTRYKKNKDKEMSLFFLSPYQFYEIYKYITVNNSLLAAGVPNSFKCVLGTIKSMHIIKYIILRKERSKK